jgi:hypothetical protein
MLLQHSCLLSSLITLAQDKSESIAKEACLAIVNISTEEMGARAFILGHDNKDAAQVRLYHDGCVTVKFFEVLNYINTYLPKC